MEKFNFTELERSDSDRDTVDFDRVNQFSSVEVKFEVVVGGTVLSLADVLKFSGGDVVMLDVDYGELFECRVNGTKIGMGEIVVVDDRIGFRIKELGK